MLEHRPFSSSLFIRTLHTTSQPFVVVVVQWCQEGKISRWKMSSGNFIQFSISLTRHILFLCLEKVFFFCEINKGTSFFHFMSLLECTTCFFYHLDFLPFSNQVTQKIEIDIRERKTFPCINKYSWSFSRYLFLNIQYPLLFIATIWLRLASLFFLIKLH